MFSSRTLARTGLFVVAIALALVLVGSSIIRFQGARRAAAAVALFEGDRLVRDVNEAVRRAEGNPERQQIELDQIVGSSPKLRYAAIIDADGQPILSAGPSLRPAGRPPVALPRFVDGLVRMEFGPPRDGPPAPPDALPPVLIAFELGEADAVVSAGWVDLLVGLTGGVGLGLLAVGAYVQDQRRAREQDQRVRERHLAHLGEMSAVLAHEIRNPLAGLKGHAQLVQEKLAGHPALDSASRVVSSAERLEELVNNLLDFAKTGELNRTWVDPVQVAHDALHRVAPDRIELMADEAPQTWSLDAVAVGRVLDNLLKNAVQASADDGVVDLVVREASGALQFEVRDRGGGFVDGEMQRIFEPFMTTRTQGTGLGLAVSLRLVTLHGGTLQAGNHPDGGAVLTATLPSA